MAPPGLSIWDLYHGTMGTALHFKSFDLTLGAGFSYGQDSIPREARGGGDPNQDPDFPPIPDGTLSYVRVKALLGIQVFIGGRRIGLGT